ncbi:S8 family peptidase [Bacillus sp. 31A1R]|uniref:S8 family peptidase n=1 Tax=Robertmurraya mangrovi TaxID=3098077 RepID=A0ABU5J317_9BACI|nr:S8 family peptidase [Bacillus sp. 31A1R]MDZ5473798.1 S8 family peptidase [Bacillus sp. 31A1R]
MKNFLLASLLLTSPIQVDNIEQPEITNWGSVPTKVTEAHQLGYSGKGVKISILDTGVTQNHPDLDLSGGQSFVPYTTNYEDDHGHGSYVAGLIGAKHNNIGIKGIAPGSEIYSLKTLDSKRKGNFEDIVKAIEWSIDNKMDIIHFSWSTEIYSPELEAALNRAYENGILIVGSAGNTNRDVRYPAKFDSVIAVSAINQNIEKAGFSCFGPEIELAAPGVSMYSLDESHLYSTSSGTTLASAHVTGILALLKERFPEKSNIDLRQLLQSTALDLGEVGRDSHFGYGLVQVPINEFTKKDPLHPTLDRQIRVNDRKSPYHGQTLTVLKQDGEEFTVLNPKDKKVVKIKPEEVVYTAVQIVHTNTRKAMYHKKADTKIGYLDPGTYFAYRKNGDWYRIHTDFGYVWIKIQ